ncbi:cellulose synthase complex outer membrane protein BcsC [Pusillimonas sp.]|uniref:cellulose synthase complex outer membrane protein BcsC n=1 Tax=Pusillimonas sp. TaxID=3040095 RepID=UPI0037CC6AF9
MRYVAWRLCLSLAIGAPNFASIVLAQSLAADDNRAVQSGEALLLQQIRLGETLYRDDIVIDAANKLDRIHENHLQGILARLRIATRLEQQAEAQRLRDRLERLAPQSLEARTGRVLVKLTEPDAIAALTQARLYSAVGRVDEAIQAYDALLEGVYPTADLALEYWQLYARQPGHRAAAIQQLQASLEIYPSHGPMLTAVANLLFSEERPDEARRYLRKLAKLDAFRSSAANREYDYLTTLPISSESRELWRGFVGTYADLDAGARGRIELARFDAKLNDPAWQGGRQGIDMIESGKGAEALHRLQQAVAAYPDDVDYLGALGVAYLRTGNRRQALHYFELAKDKEPRVDHTYRWVSLIRSTQYWLLLEEANQAEEARNWKRAKSLYQQALPLQPESPFALIGLAGAAAELGQDEAAWRHFRQALQLDPHSGVVQRGVARYLENQPPERALALLEEIPAGRSSALANLHAQVTLRLLTLRADRATEEQRWADAETALLQAQQLDPDDPWLSYGLARAMREQGRADEGLRAFETHLSRNQGASGSHYAHGLLLAAVGQEQAALDTLAAVPRTSWDDRMTQLEARVAETQLIARASAYREAGQASAAIALLEERPDSTNARMHVARWSYDDGDYSKALANYNAVLRMDGANLDARLGQMEVWQAQGKAAAVQAALSRADFDFQNESTGVHRRVADLWVALGDTDRARDVLQQRSAQMAGTEREPLLYRDLARLTTASDPQQALDLYARAMSDADMLPRQALQFQRDDVTFTRAMRANDEDGWLERGVRREAHELYERRNPTITVHNDRWWRRDGTPGLSRLHADTTMVQLNYPLFQGKGFLRADHVRMDAGTLETDADGVYRGEFGSCSFAASNTPAGWQPAPACTNGLKQRATGTSLAIGWHGDRLSFDLGTTPLGFAVTNWTGGVSYAGKLGATGWRLTASRRPMSNSLLSFAGARDPSTGVEWGGVMATGGSLSLSWDQGEENGVWADISHHRLSGKNVADNHRTRLMGGYYRRLINKNNEMLSAGVNLMYWRYNKDLGDYSLGQGGYYSPQRYTSVSLPISYARRTSNWSFLFEGSVSRSFARSVSEADTSRSAGTGYRVAGFVERRLSDHWVLGAGIDFRRSKDYSPSRFMLYLRYAFKPWQGDLPLAPNPMIPYADFK